MEHSGEIANFLREIVEEAGVLLKKEYGTFQHRIQKSSFEFKTKVDDELDSLLRQRIHQKFNNHSILSEEGEEYKGASDYTWVIDPLDGTLNFSVGLTDLFAVSVGVAYQGKMIAGAVNAAIREEFYFCEKGKGASKNGEKISVCQYGTFSDSLIAVEYGKTNRLEILNLQKKLLCEKKGSHYNFVFCNASVPLCLVAEGKLHAYVSYSLDPWDMAAGALMVEEAGGAVFNRLGKEWSYHHPSIIACASGMEEDLLKVILEESN